MTIAGTPDGVMLVLVAAIVGIVAVPLALGILGVLLSLLRRIGLNLGPAPGVLLLLGLPIALLATSMALDSSGEARTGQVIDKSERVRVHVEGDWSDDLALAVRFANDGAPLPPVRSARPARREGTPATGHASAAHIGHHI